MKKPIPNYSKGLFHLEDDRVTEDGYSLTIYSEEDDKQLMVFANLEDLEELRDHINLLLED
jgi:hypothetical protein